MPAVFEITGDTSRSLDCGDLAALLVDEGVFAEAPVWKEFKIDNPNGDGTWPTPLGVTISGYDGTSFSWTSTVGVDAVFAKSGSQGSRLFLYDPPVEATSGEAGTVQDISHITFCYDDTPPSPTTTAATTTTAAPTTTAVATSTAAPTTTAVATSTAAPTTTAVVATSAPPTTQRIEEAQVLGTVEVRAVAPGEGVPARTGAPIGVTFTVGGGLVFAGGLLSLAARRRAQQV